MTRAKQVGLGAVVLLGLAFLTNPDTESHRHRYEDDFRERHTFLGPLGFGRLESGGLKYRDFGLFSVAVENRRPVTFGVFGHVYLIRDATE